MQHMKHLVRKLRLASRSHTISAVLITSRENARMFSYGGILSPRSNRRRNISKSIAKMRMPGVEPGSQAWEACMIPLHYMRIVTPNVSKNITPYSMGDDVHRPTSNVQRRATSSVYGAWPIQSHDFPPREEFQHQA